MSDQKLSLGQYAAYSALALGAADLINYHNLDEQISWLNASFDAQTVANIGFLIATPIALIGGFLAANFAYKKFDIRRNLLLILAAFFYGKIFPLIVFAVVLPATGYYQVVDPFNTFIWNSFDAWLMADSALRWLWFVPLVMSFIDFRNSASYPFAQGAVASDGAQASGLPFIASVFSILVPIVGFALAVSAKSQIASAKISATYASEVQTAYRNASWLIAIPVIISVAAPIFIIGSFFAGFHRF
jgi:hypothetical protein